uniref:DNA topoisomerase n=1 Tax=Aegilops tauschii subsp. strangulata TaxID=200361 RepID=A0A453IUG3_AEGTS
MVVMMTRHILLFIQQSFRLVKTTGLQITRYIALPNRREISISLTSDYSNFSNLLFLCSANLIMFSMSVSAVQKVYELVVRHFLACCSQPAVGAETTVEVDIAGEQFNASGRVVLAFVPTSLTLDSGVTRPPPLLAEADLLSCMDKAGIGTDATMHEHIKKLLDRCYATKDANSRFSPTNLGEALVMGYDEMGYELWKPYLRAMMEADMKSVSVGTKSKAQVLEGCLQQMKACFLDARANKVKLLDAMGTFFARSNRPINETQNTIEVVRPCGACNDSEMLLKRRPVNCLPVLLFISSGNWDVSCLSFAFLVPEWWFYGWLSGLSSV